MERDVKTIHPNVVIGENVTIDDFCIIGYPPRGKEPGEIQTLIGDNVTIRSGTILYAGVEIGDNVQIAHNVCIREFTKIGEGSSIGVSCVIEHRNFIGKNVRIQGQTGICEHSIIEDDAWLGPQVIFMNVLHPTCPRAKECLAGPIIRSGAIIGAGAGICPDVEVGRRAFVSAGAIVTKAVEDEAIVFGNPARKIGNVNKFSCRYDMMNGVSPYKQ